MLGDILVGMRDIFGVIRMELKVKPPTLINPRSKICSTIQLHVFVFNSLFVYLIKIKIPKTKNKFVSCIYF